LPIETMPNDLSPMPNAMSDQPPASARFYEDMRSFDDFAGFTDLGRYRPLPGDWQVVIADIRGSTKAIAQGRYKDVNMMGAACITAVLNALKAFDPVTVVPYVFGGDGATLAVPSFAVAEVRQALMRTRVLCEAQFGLEMRIGIVPVVDIRARGCDLLVVKFRLSPGNYLAMFSGGGIELVDTMVKDEVGGAVYRIEETDDADTPDLDGLSCRWTPVHTLNGRIVSLLVRAPAMDADARTQAYSKVTGRISSALKQDLADMSPVSDRRFEFHWPPPAAITEARTTASGPGLWPFFRRLMFILSQSAVQYMLHRFNGRAGSYDAPSYKLEMIANTDFRRFDDVLRLVLDCSIEQVAALEKCLAALREEDGIAYGMHIADTALMTCLVFSIEESEHVHFIDGGDGGYAMAAKQLKSQLADDKHEAVPTVWDRDGNVIRARRDRDVPRTETRRKAQRD